jgi:NADH dehydrogenase FAD-containing subunit
LIGSPLALASKVYSEKAWTRYQDIPALRAQEVSHAHGSVIHVDLAKKIARIATSNRKEESEESYDYLIAASGLRRVWPVVPQSFSRAEYLVESGGHIQAVKNAKEGVVVIGGGQ